MRVSRCEMGMDEPTPTPTSTPASGNAAGGFDVLGLLWQYPWVALILLVVIIFAANFGIKKGWERLTMMYNVQGKPLAPLGVTIRKALSLMFKEDVLPASKNEKMQWLTWIKFWRIASTLLGIALVLGIVFPNEFTGGFLILASIIVLYGVGHVKQVFQIRHHTLSQMFEVAQAEMRYAGGAELNPWGYVNITEWENVYYPGQTIVMFPAKYKSESLANRAAFENHFKTTVSDAHGWTFEWEPSNNRVVCEPVPLIADKAPYNFPDQHPWNEFPLGLGSGGKEAIWDVSSFPHCLVAGTTGSGKSVTQRTMLLHALQSPDWRVVLVDPKRVELSGYANHPNVLKVATELEESVELIDQVHQEMQSRYLRMKEAGNNINHFRSLETPPPAVLLMVDETFSLLAPTGIKNDEGKAQDEMKARIGVLLSSIARLGRAAGIHMILATQRPDAKVLPGELKANLDARVAQGRMDTIPSQMTLDSDAATRLPPIKGRAILRTGGNEINEFQAYFLPPEQLDMVLEMSASIARGDRSFVDSLQQGGNEEADGGKGFQLPSINWGKIVPSNVMARIQDWVARRDAVIAENEGGNAAAVDRKARKEGKQKFERKPATSRMKKEEHYVPPHGEEELSFDEIAEQARNSGASNTGVALFSGNGDVSPFFPEGDAPAQGMPVTPSAVEEDFYEDDDDDVDVLDDLDEVEHNNASIPIVEMDDYDDYDDYDDTALAPANVSAPVAAPVAEPATPSISVQDVMKRAQERGVAIPASELLAALRAEAAKAQQAVDAAEDEEEEEFEVEIPVQETVSEEPEIVDEEPIIEELEPEIVETVSEEPVMEEPTYSPVEQPMQITPMPSVQINEPTVPSMPAAPTGPRRPTRPTPIQAPTTPPAMPAPAVMPAPPTIPAPPAMPAAQPVQQPVQRPVQPPVQAPTAPVEPEFDEAPWMPKNIPTAPQTGGGPFGLPPVPPQRQR